jgi:hypothetical protein
MVLRLFFTGLAIAAVAGAVTGCAISEQDAAVASGPRTLAVEPRLVMGGLPALKDKVLIDQVLFHVPTVTERRGDRILSDVLASDAKDEGPLFFRYDAASADPFGDVLGGERNWELGAEGDGQLTFGFEPFAQRDQLALDEHNTGVDLGELVDHTAVVHGYTLALADGTLTGQSADGDPDGNPAHPGQTNGDGDPDGNPAKNADGDPDGNPASGTDGGNSGKHVDTGAEHGLTAQAQSAGYRSYTATPFTLVLDDNFALGVPVEQLLARPEGDGEVLPIDLHVAVDRLLDDDTIAAILRAMDREAGSSAAGGVVVHGASIRQAVDIDVQSAVAVHVKETVSSGGIRVVGDHR